MAEAGPSSAPIHFIHNAPAENHELKRQYLALLSPQQIIDLCLSLDIHVPLTLKRTIWPADLAASIATLKAVKKEDTPATIPAAATTAAAAPSVSPKPADKAPGTAPAAGPSTVPAGAHPYGFTHQPAYPHTPYYQALPPGYAAYTYPGYPPPPGAYAAHHAYYAPPAAADAAHAHAHPHPHPQPAPVAMPVSDDHDLPSYEDMIVEGLTAANDPDGLAPKDLFNWMATRYPVQSNFRPSASQALQKAFKRGRFEKNSAGRYRLNPLWEGGSSSSRRATRRPQTANAPPSAAQKARPISSPFTTAPRAPFMSHALAQAHHPPNGAMPPSLLPSLLYVPRKPVAAAAANNNNMGRVVANGVRPATAPAPVPTPTPATATPATTPAVHPWKTPFKRRDPYEAAQSLLHAINFGGLLRMEEEEEDVKVKREDVGAVALGGAGPELSARAGLQAQLVLLAAQLEELAGGESGVGAVVGGVALPATPSTTTATTPNPAAPPTPAPQPTAPSLPPLSAAALGVPSYTPLAAVRSNTPLTVRSNTPLSVPSTTPTPAPAPAVTVKMEEKEERVPMAGVV
ncbi:hypothetical protein C8J57DRAFT_1214404 [Mycena rebaudengoi]|nr:hypothetical protein C8J57DRAFT_1214404 [Mycena rebaudengoi]